MRVLKIAAMVTPMVALVLAFPLVSSGKPLWDSDECEFASGLTLIEEWRYAVASLGAADPWATTAGDTGGGNHTVKHSLQIEKWSLHEAARNHTVTDGTTTMRRSAGRSIPLAWLPATILFTLAACADNPDDSAAPEPQSQLRDSAGIQIVEFATRSGGITFWARR